MERARLIRLLRMGICVASLVLCLTFVALWIRTFYSAHSIVVWIPSDRCFVATSRQGGLGIGTCILRPDKFTWEIRSAPPETKPSIKYRGPFDFGVSWANPQNFVAAR